MKPSGRFEFIINIIKLKMKKINQTYKNLFILILVAGSFFLVSKTLAVGQSFRAGETLNPGCGPLDPTCTVRLLDLYSEKATNGSPNTVTGTNAIAIGSGSTASGNYSVAVGHEDPDTLEPGAFATGDFSVAIGSASSSSGDFAVSIGGSNASGIASFAAGLFANSGGNSSVAIGEGTISPSFREVTVGSYPAVYTPVSASTWNANDLIFSVGNGLNGASRSTALSVKKSGETIANGNLTVNGDLTIADTVNEIPVFNSEISFSNGNIITNDGKIEVGNGGIRFRLQPMGSPAQSFTLDARTRKDAILLPRGTTEERDEDSNGLRRSTPAGAIRYNTDINKIEVTQGADNWVVLGGGSGGGLIDENSDLSDAGDISPSATGENSLAIGLGTSTIAKGEISLGTYPILQSEDFGDFDNKNILMSLGSGSGNSDRSNAMIVLRNGQIGLGNLSQDAVAGAENIAILTDTGAFLSKDGTWTNASDQSLKTDIRTLGYGLDEVLDLKPREFNFERSGKAGIGFIAQEVEKVIPEIVSESGLGTKGVEYGQLTAVLVNAIIELENRVAYLESSGGVRAPAVEREEEGFVEVEEESVPKVENPAVAEPEAEENQEASLIKASNAMNVTNLLLMLAVALLILNLAVLTRGKKVA